MIAAARILLVVVATVLAGNVVRAQGDPVAAMRQVEELKKKWAAEHAALLKDWKENRDAYVKSYVRRGATPEEAEAAMDAMIAKAEEPFTVTLTFQAKNVPQMVALQRKMLALSALSNLGHHRLQRFAEAHGIEINRNFLQCLCASWGIAGAGIGYHPEFKWGNCETTLPCKGGNWGCVAHPLPSDPAVNGRCAATHAPEMIGTLVDKVAATRKDYDRDVCARLESLLDATREMQLLKQLKEPRDSRMAGEDFENTIFDALGPTSGVLETLWGGLERIPVLVGAFQPEETGLATLLTEKTLPSQSGMDNLYIRATKEAAVTESVPYTETVVEDGKSRVIERRTPPLRMSYEMALAWRILRSEGNLSPGSVLRMATEVTGGDVPLAALVTHNLLKEAAYGRRGNQIMRLSGPLGRKLDPKNPEDVAIAKAYQDAFGGLGVYGSSGFSIDNRDNIETMIRSKLSDIRPVYDADVEDRLGPWYHVFGLMFVGTNPVLGENSATIGAWGENVTRLLNLGSGRSLGKEAANRCAVKIIGRMNEVLGTNRPPPSSALPPAPFTVPVIEPIIPLPPGVKIER